MMTIKLCISWVTLVAIFIPPVQIKWGCTNPKKYTGDLRLYQKSKNQPCYPF